MKSADAFPNKVNSILARHGRSLAGCRKILDFGCGSGRLLRNLPSATEAEIWGVDLDGAAIGFCRASFPFGTFLESQEFPDGTLPEASFDLIYAFSVLTHLDERHQDVWLAEWRRVAAPGAMLLVTYKNEQLLERSNYVSSELDRARAEILDKGIAFRATGYWHAHFPDFYQGAFHSDEYVRAHWGKYFSIRELIPAGPAFAQNLAVMRND